MMQNAPAPDCRHDAARSPFFAPTVSLPSRPLAYALLALSMSLVGAYVALSKPLAAAFPVFLLAWLRFGIGGVAMLGWLRRPPDEPPLTRQTQALLFLHALLGNFLFTVFMIYGVSLTSAASAGVVMASIPACVAVMSWLFLRERIAPRTWAAVACAVAGIALFTLAQPASPAAAAAEAAPPAPGMWLGYLLLVAASVCEGAYSVIGKKLTGTLGPRRITALINLWGLALATPAGLWLAWRFDFAAIAPGTWLLLLFYGLAACTWSVWLWMTGLKSVPAAQAGVFTVFLPVSAAVVGIAFLGERFTALQAVAFGVALASVLLASFPSRAALRVGRPRR
ncbi:threonine/homoserine efflux transporter RhtA [Melaminivora alkalimesophila]|uniref:Threonine/homoserine efflux transporter RhtA n=2 Tax=Melaminivora alkalimesophila TaxID=1165852 RepID=A0A317RFT5_9BURK|nr:threonine/homoserine efflux transporter RhtA [Melaminivora alkalimesophila]